MKKKIINILLLLPFIYLAFNSLDLNEVLISLKNVEIKFLIPLLAFQLVTLSLIAYQWYYLLNKENYQIRFFQILKVNFAASFIESITPSSKFGGEAAKIFLLKKEIGEDYTKLTTALIVHKYISLLPFFIIVFTALFLSLFKYQVPKVMYISFISLIFLIFITFKTIFSLIDKENRSSNIQIKSNRGRIWTDFFHKINRVKIFLSTSLKETRGYLNTKDKVRLMSLSFFIWFSYPLKIYLVSRILNVDLDLLLCYIATFISYVIGILPLSPGGLGTFETSLAFVLNINYINFSDGMAIALVSRLIVFWFPLVISIFVSIYITIFQRDYKEKKITI